ncbi:MAG: hypothetical protein WC498_03670 [Candidatus Saccharimonadales bacterium]
MKAKKTNSKKPILLSIVVVLVVAILGAGSFFGLKAYEKLQADKIYSTGDTVKFPDFDFQVTKAEFKEVDLPVDEKTVAKYGALDKPEDCEKLSKAPTMTYLGTPEPVPYGPSDFNICIRRNDSRKGINDYSANNQQLVVDYAVTANGNIATSNLKIEFLVDSGRKLDEQVNTFNGTQFFRDGAQEKMEFGGVTMYTPELGHEYIPYYQSEIGGDINKGLSRNGYTYTDIRNSENSVDIKVTYSKDGKEQTRIVRVLR